MRSWYFESARAKNKTCPQGGSGLRWGNPGLEEDGECLSWGLCVSCDQRLFYVSVSCIYGCLCHCHCLSPFCFCSCLGLCCYLSLKDGHKRDKVLSCLYDCLCPWVPCGLCIPNCLWVVSCPLLFDVCTPEWPAGQCCGMVLSRKRLLVLHSGHFIQPAGPMVSACTQPDWFPSTAHPMHVSCVLGWPAESVVSCLSGRNCYSCPLTTDKCAQDLSRTHIILLSMVHTHINLYSHTPSSPKHWISSSCDPKITPYLFGVTLPCWISQQQFSR